jgi:ATP-dependent DNA helicase RecQ
MEYFGEVIPGYCGNCDSCIQPKGTFDGTEAAIKLIGCIQELNQRFGTNYIIDVLTGSKNKKIKQNRHERLKSHGSGREFTKEQWRSLASEMTNTGLLDVSGAQYPVLKLNVMSRKILKGLDRVELVCPAGFEPVVEEDMTSSMVSGTEDDKTENDIQFSTVEIPSERVPTERNSTEEFQMETVSKEIFSTSSDLLKKSQARKKASSGKEPDLILFERLKALRKEVALNKNLPPYIIFSDTTLKEMATRFPHTPDEFHSITGVGDHKLRKYGDTFLKEIDDYCRDYGLISTEKVGNSGNLGKQSENKMIKGKNEAQKDESFKTDEGIFELKLPIPQTAKLHNSGTNNSEVKVSNSEICTLPAKRARYLDMSIQDWSGTPSIFDTGIDDSIKTDSIGVIETESENKDPIKKEPLETDLFETDASVDSLQRTFSLFTQGLGIDEIAEIQGLSIGAVFKQFEQLILAGKVRDIGGFLPSEKQQEIKAALDTLETELDLLIQTKMGENCQEEEFRLIKALLLSRICYSKA